MRFIKPYTINIEVVLKVSIYLIFIICLFIAFIFLTKSIDSEPMSFGKVEIDQQSKSKVKNSALNINIVGYSNSVTNACMINNNAKDYAMINNTGRNNIVTNNTTKDNAEVNNVSKDNVVSNNTASNDVASNNTADNDTVNKNNTENKTSGEKDASNKIIADNATNAKTTVQNTVSNLDNNLDSKQSSLSKVSNIQQETIVLDDDNFTEWMDQVYLNIDKYEEKEIQLVGFVYKIAEYGESEFSVARMLMTCCVADMQTTGFLCNYDKTVELTQDSWVKVTGRIKSKDYNGHQIPIILVEKVEKVEKPNKEYVYPNY